MLPLGVTIDGLTGNSAVDRHGDALWLGIASRFTVFDPFVFAFDAAYGSVDLGGYQK